MGRVARSERSKSQLRAEARGLKRAKRVMAQPAPKRKPTGVLAPGAKFNRKTGKITPPKPSKRQVQKAKSVMGRGRQTGPILGMETRRLQAEARKVRRDRDELRRNQQQLKVVLRRDPAKAKSYTRVPLPKRERTAEGREFKFVERKAPAVSRSFFDPITKKAKRDAAKAEVRLTSRVQRKAAKDAANLLRKPKRLSEVPGKRESAENLRDLKLLSGESRLDRAIKREKARQVRASRPKSDPLRRVLEGNPATASGIAAKDLVAALKAGKSVGEIGVSGAKLLASLPLGAGQGLPAGVRRKLAGRTAVASQELAKDPVGQVKKNTGTGAKMVQSIVPGLAAAVTQPVKTAKESVKEPIQRWNESDEAFRKRVKKEGFVPELLDATVVVGGGGALASRALQRAAATGKLGAKAKRTAGYTRRELVSAGEKGAVVTGPSKSFLRNAARQKVDARRVRKVKARVERDRARGRESDLLDVEAAERDLPTVGRRRRARKARRMGARDQGRNFIMFKSEQAEEVTGRSKDTIGSQIGRLSKQENIGYRYVAEFGIRDRKTFVRELKSIREKMVENRRAANERRLDRGERPLTIVTDQVAEIDRILKAPDKFFTPKVLEVAQTVGPKQRRLAVKDDPGVTEATVERRRLKPFEAMYGIEDLSRADAPDPGQPAAMKAIQRRVVPEKPYDPTPEGINSRRFYHGSSKGMKRSEVVGDFSNPGSLFGSGFYMTDNPSVAMGYAKTRGKRKGKPVLNEVELRVKKPLDLEGKLNRDWVEAIVKESRIIDETDAFAAYITRNHADEIAALARKKGTTNEKIYKRFQEQLRELPGSESSYYLSSIQESLMKRGYDALVHRGGGRVGKIRHQVVILLEPKGLGSRFGRDARGKLMPQQANVIKRMKPVGKRIPESRAAKLMQRAETGGKRTAAEQNAITRQAMRDRGLDPELTSYFKNMEFSERGFKNYAMGGRRAVADDRTYEGKLLKTGQSVSDARIVTDSAAGNLKRKYNWNQVAQWAERSVAPWSKNYKGKLRDLDREARSRGLRPGSYVFVDLRKIYAARDRGASQVDLDVDSPLLRSTEVSEVLRDPRNVVDPVRRDLDNLIETDPKAFDTTGWSVVSKADYEELVNRTTPSGKAGRVIDMARGAASRWLLLNLPWLVFQTGSNTLLSALAGITPNDLRRAARFFKELPPEERRALEATFGVKGWYDERPRGGAAFDNRFAHMISAWKKTEHYRRWRQYGVPGWLEVFSRLDNMQNNAFRRAVFYKTAKSEAFTRMNDATGRAYGTLPRLESALSKKSHEEVMRAIVKERESVEQLGRAVDDWLGDWTSFTAAERKWMVRIPLFYGFIRFSTRLAFYTMPLNHPVLSAILLKLGDLSRKELEAIFGKEGSEPPPWEYGNFYRYNSATGETKRYTLARMVPFFNALQVTNQPEDVLNPQVADLLGLVNPLFLVAFQQAAMKNSAGREMYDLKNEDGSDPGVFDARRFRLLVAQLLGYNWYARSLEKTGIPGVREPFRGRQQADSSIVFPRPKVYKRDKERLRNERVIAQQRGLGVGGAAKERFAPFLGTETLPVFENAKAFAERKGKKKKAPAMPTLPALPELPELPE